jgi:rhomboid protease GluP
MESHPPEEQEAQAQPAGRPARPGVPVTYTLIALIVGIWLAGEVLGDPLREWLFDHFAESAAEIWDGEYWRLLTYGLLHGGFLHILFNAYGLRVLGPFIERIYGGPRFLAGFLLAVVGGGVAGVLAAPYRGLVSAVGASGGLFGLVGMHAGLVLNYRRVLRRDFLRASWRNLLLILGINGAYGLLNPRVDNMGHIGGFLAGLAWGLAITVPVIPYPLPRGALRRRKLALLVAGTALTIYALIPARESAAYRTHQGIEALSAARWSEAEEAFRFVIGVQPDYAPAHYWLAGALIEQGRLHEALIHAEIALRLEPDNETMRDLVARLRLAVKGPGPPG